jgi:Tetracyclin repressor-like, C-terminal domain
MSRREKSDGGIFDPVEKWLRLPFSTPEFVNRMVSGSVNEVGRRTLQTLITAWDVADGGPFAASAIATTGLAKTIDVVHDQLTGPVFGPLLKAIGADQVTFRAALCASQLVGLGVVRYVARAEPIHSMDAERLSVAMAPTLQRYLVGDIS